MLFPCILTHRLFVKSCSPSSIASYRQVRVISAVVFPATLSSSLSCSPLLSIRTLCPFPGCICFPFSHSQVSPLPTHSPACSLCCTVSTSSVYSAVLMRHREPGMVRSSSPCIRTCISSLKGGTCGAPSPARLVSGPCRPRQAVF